MRNVFKMALVLGVVALVAAPVLAQRPGGGGFGGGMSIGQLLGNASVQKEIGLDEEGAKKVEDALKKVRDDNADLYKKLGDFQLPREERAELTKKATELTTAAVKDLVKPEQMKRVKEIQVQQMGFRVYTDADMQKALKLTDDQIKDIKTISDDLNKERETLFPRGQRPAEGAQEKFAKISTEAKEKATKMLSADQKKTLEELTGKPFEIKFERRP